MPYSLLRKNETADIDVGKREMLRDLNLDQVIDRICEGWGDEVKELYHQLPGDGDNSDYRRAAFSEIKGKDLHPVFTAFLEKMRQRLVCMERRERVEVKAQKQVWLAGALHDWPIMLVISFFAALISEKIGVTVAERIIHQKN